MLKINYDELIFKLRMFINIIWFLRHTKLKTKALSSKENKWQNLGKGTSIYVFLKSDAHMNSTHILKKPLISHFAYTSALCSLPHWKVSIRDLSQILTTDPIFLSFDFFRQNIWVSFFVQFHFQDIFGAKLVFPSSFLVF